MKKKEQTPHEGLVALYNTEEQSADRIYSSLCEEITLEELERQYEQLGMIQHDIAMVPFGTPFNAETLKQYPRKKISSWDTPDLKYLVRWSSEGRVMIMNQPSDDPRSMEPPLYLRWEGWFANSIDKLIELGYG